MSSRISSRGSPSRNSPTSCSACISFRDKGLTPRFLGFFGALHDEAEARRRILSHQFVDHAIGHNLVGDFNAEQAPGSGIQRRLPQDLRHHFAQALESGDLGLAAIAVSHLLFHDAVALRVVERPERLLADIDAVERWLRQKHLAVG
jgi:hypothetical protein